MTPRSGRWLSVSASTISAERASRSTTRRGDRTGPGRRPVTTTPGATTTSGTTTSWRRWIRTTCRCRASWNGRSAISVIPTSRSSSPPRCTATCTRTGSATALPCSSTSSAAWWSAAVTASTPRSSSAPITCTGRTRGMRSADTRTRSSRTTSPACGCRARSTPSPASRGAASTPPMCWPSAMAPSRGPTISTSRNAGRTGSGKSCSSGSCGPGSGCGRGNGCSTDSFSSTTRASARPCCSARWPRPSICCSASRW